MYVQMCSRQHTKFKFQFPLNYLQIELKAVPGMAGKERDYICHKRNFKRLIIKQNQNSIHSFEEDLLFHRYQKLRKIT